jgi:hypothetical protein
MWQPARPPRYGAAGWYSVGPGARRISLLPAGKRRAALVPGRCRGVTGRDKLRRLIMATAIWPPGVPCPSGVPNVPVRLAAIVFTSSDPGELLVSAVTLRF